MPKCHKGPTAFFFSSFSGLFNYKAFFFFFWHTIVLNNTPALSIQAKQEAYYNGCPTSCTYLLYPYFPTNPISHWSEGKYWVLPGAEKHASHSTSKHPSTDSWRVATLVWGKAPLHLCKSQDLICSLHKVLSLCTRWLYRAERIVWAASNASIGVNFLLCCVWAKHRLTLKVVSKLLFLLSVQSKGSEAPQWFLRSVSYSIDHCRFFFFFLLSTSLGIWLLLLLQGSLFWVWFHAS